MSRTHHNPAESQRIPENRPGTRAGRAYRRYCMGDMPRRTRRANDRQVKKAAASLQSGRAPRSRLAAVLQGWFIAQECEYAGRFGL